MAYWLQKSFDNCNLALATNVAQNGECPIAALFPGPRNSNFALPRNRQLAKFFRP